MKPGCLGPSAKRPGIFLFDCELRAPRKMNPASVPVAVLQPGLFIYRLLAARPDGSVVGCFTGKSGSLEGEGCRSGAPSSRKASVSRPVKPFCPLNRRCHRRGVRRAQLHRGGRIPGRHETVLRKSPVEEDVPRRCIAALGLIRDAAAHEYKSIDVIADVNPAAGAALRNHGGRGVDFQIAVRLFVVHLDVARCREEYRAPARDRFRGLKCPRVLRESVPASW